MKATTQHRRLVSVYKVLRVVLWFLLAFTIILGALTILWGGFIDFPCFVRYNEAEDCISMENASGRWDKVQDDARIETFLTTYKAGWSGGGCNHKIASEDTLEQNTSVGTLTLDREGETLKVDGRILGKGQSFKRTHALIWNPWIIAQTQFTNVGVVADCESESPARRLVVIGRYGTQISLVKGGSILIALIAGLALVNRRLKASREDRI
jgi:hypothetical protein